MKPIEWEKLKQRRVTVPVVVLIGFLFVGFRMEAFTVDYLSKFFVTVAVAEDISKAVAANARIIGSHIHEYKVNEAEKAITNIEDALFNLSQWVAVNEDNAITRQRTNELERRLDDWRDYKDCLVNRGINCASVRP